MIDYVHTNPLYVQCLLHIKAYRDYHKEEREEFKERIEVLDERYSRYNNLINSIQISIIVLSAISAFVQAGNNVFQYAGKVFHLPPAPRCASGAFGMDTTRRHIEQLSVNGNFSGSAIFSFKLVLTEWVLFLLLASMVGRYLSGFNTGRLDWSVFFLSLENRFLSFLS